MAVASGRADYQVSHHAKRGQVCHKCFWRPKKHEFPSIFASRTPQNSRKQVPVAKVRLELDCKNKRHIRWPFGRLALLLARHSPVRGCSALAPRQPPKWPAGCNAYFCNQAPEAARHGRKSEAESWTKASAPRSIHRLILPPVPRMDCASFTAWPRMSGFFAVAAMGLEGAFERRGIRRIHHRRGYLNDRDLHLGLQIRLAQPGQQQPEASTRFRRPEPRWSWRRSARDCAAGLARSSQPAARAGPGVGVVRPPPRPIE